MSKLGKFVRKECLIYVFQVRYSNTKDKIVTLQNILVIHDFVDVFPKNIPGLPPKWDIDFTIEIVPGAVMMSKAMYYMSVPKLIELKM